MGGLAVAIEWPGEPDHERFETMCMLIRHRAPAGIRIAHQGRALVGEARTHRDATTDWAIETLGSLSIVGDIRLWNRGGLEALGHMTTRTRDLSDRAVLLSAYRRRGAGMMDVVDGDFAFVIWDEEHHTVMVARDRFGVKPLFVSRTSRGLSFASEAKQLLAYDNTLGELSPDGVAQYLTGTFVVDRSTAYEGVHRILPGHTLVATHGSFTESRYWDVRNAPQGAIAGSDVPDLFREQMIDSVSRRLNGSTHAVSQLSGGLDSAAIAASASVLTQRGLDPTRFTTISALFEGTRTDESPWIRAIAANQPFRNVTFEHEQAGISLYGDDMKRIDAPMAFVLRDVTMSTGEIASGSGADLVLTGNGGDNVVGDDWVLADTLRTNGWGPWRGAVAAIADESALHAAARTVRSLRAAAPEAAKAPFRSLRRDRHDSDMTPLTDEKERHLRSLHREHAESIVQSGIDALAAGLPNGLSLRTLEHLDTQYSAYGLEVSHPYLDRTLVEFVAMIDPASRPVGSRNKELVRSAYADLLPRDVLSRRGKTNADDVIRSSYLQHAPSLVERFGSVTASAEEYIDPYVYGELLNDLGSGTESLDLLATLWRVWSFMSWAEFRDDGGGLATRPTNGSRL